MAGSISVDDVIKQIEDAATAATNPDEKALQIDYNALRDNIRKAVGTRKSSADAYQPVFTGRL